jgi:hypothetical protein
MSDHTLGGATAKGVKNAMAARRGHGNDINVELDRSIDDCFWYIARSKNYSWQTGPVSGGNAYGGRRMPDMEQMEGPLVNRSAEKLPESRGPERQKKRLSSDAGTTSFAAVLSLSQKCHFYRFNRRLKTSTR